MAPQIEKTSQLVPLDLIDVPKRWRRVNKAAIDEIAESVKVDGLLQPIAVRPINDRFRLVFGRHRLEAFRKLERADIAAIIMEIDDIAEASATDAENLFRSQLAPAERLVALKRWHARYAAEHPESHDKKTGSELHNDDAEERAPTFVQHAADTTGVPRKTLERHLTTAKGLTEDELFTLSDREVGQEMLDVLARLKDPDQKRAAISLIASGLDPKEAVATATLPPNATASEVIHESAPVKAEADMTDAEWLETYCGELLARLKFQVIFKRDALIYRHSADLRHRLKAGTKKILSQSKAQLVGPFFLRLTKLINTDHPKNWLPCGPCGGTGMSGDNSKCGYCNGHAYGLKQGGR